MRNLLSFYYFITFSFSSFHHAQPFLAPSQTSSYAGTALWNNLLEPEGKKSHTWMPLKDKLLCPTEEHPYIYTYDNS